MSKENINEMLIKEAENAAQKAYAPYSDFHVGAAVMSDDGTIYTGCNIENSSYGASNCAERTAIFKGVSDGKIHFSKIAIVSDSDELTWPCGICRQVMSEFMEKDAAIILESHGQIQSYTLDEMLPHSFSSDTMNK